MDAKSEWTIRSHRERTRQHLECILADRLNGVAASLVHHTGVVHHTEVDATTVASVTHARIHARIPDHHVANGGLRYRCGCEPLRG